MTYINVEVDNVDTPAIEWARMYQDWELLHDLLGGTRQMRDRAEVWLPREPKEKMANYRTRLSRSFLYNGLKDTLRNIAAKPFGRPVTIEGDDGRVEAWRGDMDLEGTNATQFTRSVFNAGATYGLSHVFVDSPALPNNASRQLEESMRVRPFFRHVSPVQLIGWRSEVSDQGGRRLTSLRFRETTMEPHGTWGSRTVHWIRQYDVTDSGGTYEVWKSPDERPLHASATSVDFFQTPDVTTLREWEKVEEGPFNFRDRTGRPAIPLVTAYFNRRGFMIAEPPLLELAWMNLLHWQSMSDQRNILRFARIAQLFARGFTKDDLEEMESMSVNQVWRAKDVKADIKYIEHSGEAIGAGEEDLRRIEERMEVLGLRPLLERTVDQTATGVAVNEARSSSDVLAWIEATEDAMKRAFDMAFGWAGEEVPEDFDFNVFSDFSVGIGVGDFEQVQKMRDRGDITKTTAILEAQRRGIIAEGLDVEAEVQATDEEAAAEAQRVMNELSFAQRLKSGDDNQDDPEEGDDA